MPSTFARAAVAAALSLLSAAAAQAQATPPAKQPQPQDQPFSGEQLLFDAPDGWAVVQTRTIQRGALRIRVQVRVPPEQGPNQRERLVDMVQVHAHTPPHRYLQNAAAESAQQCVHWNTSPSSTDAYDGYPGETQHRYCDHDRSDGFCRTLITKALGGHESLYVVEYVKAYPCSGVEQFSAEESKRWKEFFDSVSVCDQHHKDCQEEGTPEQREST